MQVSKGRRVVVHSLSLSLSLECKLVNLLVGSASTTKSTECNFGLSFPQTAFKIEW